MLSGRTIRPVALQEHSRRHDLPRFCAHVADLQFSRYWIGAWRANDTSNIDLHITKTCNRPSVAQTDSHDLREQTGPARSRDGYVKQFTLRNKFFFYRTLVDCYAVRSDYRIWVDVLLDGGPQ